MRILVTDGLTKEGIEKLFQAGFEVTQKKFSQAELKRNIRDYDALIVRSGTKVSREVIEAGENLKIIGRAGIGVDNIDVEAATERGIVVKIAPGGSSNAVAELTIGLMIALSRNIPQSHRSLKNKRWQKSIYQGRELYKKTLGIIGCGRIGRRLAEIASQGHKMKVIGYDILSVEHPEINFVDLETLLKTSDYVSLHLPPQPSPVVGGAELKKMKSTAYLINTSRGGNVDEEALFEALEKKWIAGAGLDVYQEEGKEGEPFENKLFELDNFIGVSHLGAATDEAQEKTGIEIAEVVIGYLREGDWKNAINVGARISYKPEPMPVHQLWVLHEDVPGMFYKILGILKAHNINVLDIPAEGMGGKAQGIFRTREKPSPEAIKEIEALEGVHRVMS